jgi:hypothetical protein
MYSQPMITRFRHGVGSGRILWGVDRSFECSS